MSGLVVIDRLTTSSDQWTSDKRFYFSSPTVVKTPSAGDSLFRGGDITSTGGCSTGNGFSGSVTGQTRDTGFGILAGQTGSSLFGTKFGATSFRFGQTSATSAFGGASANMAVVGTTVPFNPPNGQDTMMKRGVTTNINTKHQRITAMKEYENASLEEVHVEDYKRQACSTRTVGLFWQTPSTLGNTGFVFGGGLGSGLQTSTAGFGTFGANATGSIGGLFSGTSQANTGSSFLFSKPIAGTGFGARPGGFIGFGTSAGQTGSSLFGTSQTSATGAFGGASASIAAVGTTVPFNPPNGHDTMMKSGVTTNINTKHQCITAMKEYENKSLEEVHVEDYKRQACSTRTVGLFGQTPSTQANTGFAFGRGLGSGLEASTTGFGTFGANATGSIGGLFPGTSQANTGSSFLFSKPIAGTGFGARSGGFIGFGTSAGQTGSSLFGTSQTSATGAFGGASASIAAVGTTVPFYPPYGLDTMMKRGVTTIINTKHQCITAMKEYGNRSLEELRMEDYYANRKSKQADSISTVSLFGQDPSTQANTGFVFGRGLGSGLHTSTTGFGNTNDGNGKICGDQSGTNQTPSFTFGGTGFGKTENSSGFSFGANAHASGTGFGARSGGFRFTGQSGGEGIKRKIEEVCEDYNMSSVSNDVAEVRNAGTKHKKRLRLSQNIKVVQQLKEQNNQLRKRTMCKICMDKELAVVFRPCGHFVSCRDCAVRLKYCPVCRRKVRRIVRAFIA